MKGLLKKFRSLFGGCQPAAAAREDSDLLGNRLRAAVDWDEGERRLNVRAYEARIEVMAAHLGGDCALASELTSD